MSQSTNKQEDTTASVEPHAVAQGDANWVPPRVGLGGTLIALGLAITGALGILAAWQLPPFATSVQGTEDAYVRGRTTVISPQASGYVEKVLVKDYQLVKKGELLLQIDDSIYQQELDAAKAQVDVALANLANNDQNIASRRADVEAANASVKAAQAALDKAAIDDKRASDLSTQGAGPIAQVDSARAALETAKAGLLQANASVATAQEAVKSAVVLAKVLTAQVEVARANQRQAEINLTHTQIMSPEDGQLSDIGVRLGQYVTNGSQLFFLVPDARWVIGNFKERQTSDMLAGQPAYFSVDALGDRKFTGRVDEISPATGSEFSILRPDNATGNFTKVPQRIPVRIIPDAGQAELARLRPGMSVEVYVDTKGYKY
ncbi:Multidrug resistance efflux pump [Neorhizobium galegae bv. orientalis]|nr:Multidrug resistance efflux pump [Neorhizobium galegae bv. orientalis]